MKVLRVCHTFPSEDHPNASIQLYYLNKFSKYESIYFIRDQKSKLKKKFNKNFYIFKNLTSFKNLNKILLNIKMFFFFSFCVKQKKNLIIHCHNISYLPLAIMIKLFHNNRIYLSLGGTDLHIFLKFKQLLKLLKYFNQIFVVSSNFQKILFSHKIKNVINHENGVDEKIFKNLNLERTNTFVCIANIRPVKGLENLIKSFTIFLEKKQNYKLIIIGKIYYDEYYYSLLDLIKKNKLEQYIKFTDSLDSFSISKILNQSKLSLLSSIREGFPKVIIESISCLTPVIANDVGNIKDIINGCGLISNNNINIFANNMIELISDKKKYNLTVKNCFKLRNRYSWQNVVNIIDNGYLKI